MTASQYLSEITYLHQNGLATTEQNLAVGCCHKFSGAPCCESGPNDVWSLGVSLSTLPVVATHKKQVELRDQIYSTYLRDPHFHQSILPLSNNLDIILRRIFELNPPEENHPSTLSKSHHYCT